MRDIMHYYNPKYFAIIGIFASLVASFSLPMFGFILSQMVFTLMQSIDTPEKLEDYKRDRNFWTICFGILVLGIAISTFV